VRLKCNKEEEEEEEIVDGKVMTAADRFVEVLFFLCQL
jgi:hypothetical protein